MIPSADVLTLLAMLAAMEPLPLEKPADLLLQRDGIEIVLPRLTLMDCLLEREAMGDEEAVCVTDEGEF